MSGNRLPFTDPPDGYASLLHILLVWRWQHGKKRTWGHKRLLIWWGITSGETFSIRVSLSFRILKSRRELAGIKRLPTSEVILQHKRGQNESCSLKGRVNTQPCAPFRSVLPLRYCVKTATVSSSQFILQPGAFSPFLSLSPWTTDNEHWSHLEGERLHQERSRGYSSLLLCSWLHWLGPANA